MADDAREPTEEELESRLQKLLAEGENANPEELDEIDLKLREFEDRLDAHAEGRAREDQLFDAEFEDRLKSLHDRADRAKGKDKATQKRKDYPYVGDVSRTDARGLGMGLSIAYTILGVPLVGVGVGWLVDRQLGTTSGKGIGMLVGAVIGFAVAFSMMNRSNHKE